MISFRGRHFMKCIILMAIRWYLAYALSYRDIEERKRSSMYILDRLQRPDPMPSMPLIFLFEIIALCQVTIDLQFYFTGGLPGS